MLRRLFIAPGISRQLAAGDNVQPVEVIVADGFGVFQTRTPGPLDIVVDRIRERIVRRFAVAQRLGRDVHGLFEQASEILLRIDADAVGNVDDRHIGAGEQVVSLLHPVVGHVVDHRDAAFLFKQTL